MLRPTGPYPSSDRITHSPCHGFITGTFLRTRATVLKLYLDMPTVVRAFRAGQTGAVPV